MLLLLSTNALATAQVNAASQYRDAFKLLDAIGDDRLESIVTVPAYLDLCDPDLQRSVDRIVAIAHRGSRTSDCDFELDFDQGPELLLPHLSPMRNTGRVLLRQARRDAAFGRMQNAVEALGSINRMAFHLRRDRTLISSLVGQSLWGLSSPEIDVLIEQDAIDPQQASILLASLDGLDPSDPMGMTDALEMEQISIGNWLRRTMIEEGVENDSKQALVELGITMPSSDAVQLELEIRKYESFMEQIVLGMRLDDQAATTRRLAELEAEMKEGEHGFLTSLLAPALTHLVPMRFRLSSEVAGLKDRLRRIADGDAASLGDPNAALVYIETARMIDGWTDAQRMDPAIVEQMLDTMMMAALMERCEFPLDESAPRPTVPFWTTGMLQAGTLLNEKARDRFESGDIAGAVRRLTATLGLASALSDTPHLLDSVVAQDLTFSAMSLVERMDDLEVLDAGDKRLLLDALREIPSNDPFGYQQSADASRKLLARYLDEIGRPVTVDIPTGADGTLYALTYHELHNHDHPTGHCWPLMVDLDAVADIVDAAMIKQTRQMGLDSIEAAELGTPLPLEPTQDIVIRPIRKRRIEAATRLKQWKRRLGG